MSRKLRRRDVIRGLGAAGVIGLAGCADDDGGGGDGDGGAEDFIANKTQDYNEADGGDGGGGNESDGDEQTAQDAEG